MRWKISHHGHDPRQIDLLAILALLIVIGTALRYFDGGPEPPVSIHRPAKTIRKPSIEKSLARNHYFEFD